MEQTLTVNAKALTITGVSGAGKIFDGTTTATLNGTASLLGVLVADEANVTLGGTYSANFSQSAVGTSLSITVSGYSISGSAANNYSLTQPSGLTADITPAGPSAPTANAASGKTTYSFSANWDAVSGATGYKLDVATDAGFTSLVSGYNDLAVSGVTKLVGGLTVNTVYYYRLRATNADGTSANSNTITTGTLAVLNVNTPTIIASDSYTNTAITVSGAELTVNSAITVPKIVVESAAQLVVNSAMTVDTLTFKAGITGTFSAKIDNAITANTVRFLKTLNPSKWFFMSFPCNVDIAKIKRTDGAALIYNDDIFIKYYDGANRSNGNYGANWLLMASNGTLMANHGYIIGLKDGLGNVELEFPLEPTLVATAEAQRTVQVAGNQGTSSKTTDKGWNLVGQPYLSKFTGGNATGVNYMLFSDGGSTYTTRSRADNTLSTIDPFAAYFIQVEAAGNIPFTVGGRTLAPSAVAVSTSDIVQLNMTTATGTDKTSLIMDNDQSTAYQIGQDMEKWIGFDTAKPQVYSVLGGINYAYNALPMSSVVNLPLGMYTQTAGNTTISANATQAASLTKLLLTDNGVSPAITTDLLATNYTFTATAGTSNTRFSITAQRITTDNNLVGNELTDIGISIVNGKLLMINVLPSTMVRVYDALGRMLISKNATSNTMEIKLNARGIYTIQLQSGLTITTRKVIF